MHQIWIHLIQTHVPVGEHGPNMFANCVLRKFLDLGLFQNLCAVSALLEANWFCNNSRYFEVQNALF